MMMLFFFIFTSCKKDPPLFKIQNLNGNRINCFGHAGMGDKSLYPINTLESIQSCLTTGADGSEMDIQISSDSTLVIFHEEDLSESTLCNGEIYQNLWNNISNCHYKALLSKSYKLISFDELIQQIPNPKDYIFTFDCKTHYVEPSEYELFSQRFARAISRCLDKYHLNKQVYIESKDPVFLTELKKINPDFYLYLYTDDFYEGARIGDSLDLYGLTMDNNLISESQIEIAHNKNLRISLFNVNTEKENYSAVEKSPDNIQTDDLKYLLKIFGKYKK